MELVNDAMVFHSGKRVYCHADIVGINPDGDIYYGYDGTLPDEDLTRAERQELAEYMIGLWKAYGEARGEQ